MVRISSHKQNLDKFLALKVNLVTYTFLGLFVLVLIKLFSVQVLSHDKFRSEAQSQYSRYREIPPKRGDIYTSDGFLLAGTERNYLLFAEPKNIENSSGVAEQLADLLATDAVETTQSSSALRKFGLEEFIDDNNTTEETKTLIFTELLTKYKGKLSENLGWVPLQRNISERLKNILDDQDIYGIGFDETPARFYPENTLASHVLGFVGSDEHGEKLGYFGIEGSFNDELKGKPGRIIEEIDSYGMPILVGNYKKYDTLEGRSLVLTINRSIQYIVEKRLEESVKEYDAKSGTVIVMNPNTGEILAMANYPTYHPAEFLLAESEPDDEASIVHRKDYERMNLSVSQIYEPGSVIKPFTVSAAVQLGLVTPNTTFQDNGPVEYSGYTINNWDGNHHGTQTIVQLLQKSNNIGAAWVGHQVGAKKLSEYLHNFGFGEKTGVDLEGEDTGHIRDYKEWTDIDLATAAFGQGISATPLQVLNGFNVIANGGYLLQPQIVSKIKDGEKEILIPSKNIRQVISKETSDTMVDMLEKAVEGGEAKFFVSKQYRIAGKTGTAQIPKDGKYDPNKTNATFVGYLAGNKEFSMIVKLQEPRTSIYAAETAVPTWMSIANDLVKYYGIVPDKEQNSN